MEKELLLPEITYVSPDRNRKDVGLLKQAILSAESVYNANRVRLYDLYHDIVTIDGHLSGIIEKRTKSVTNKKIVFVDSKGRKVDELDTLINSNSFERLLELIMESVYWGISGVEFIPGKDFSFAEIDRRHIRPEKNQVTISQYDFDGEDVSNYPGVWLIGERKNLGKLLQCSMFALYKRSCFGDFAQYVEIFGQPVRIIQYDAYDKQTETRLREILDKSGSSLVMMLPKQAQFQMMDGKTSNGSGELQERLIQACNREMSIAILGNTETTSSSSSSGYAQAEIHAGQQNQLTQADLRYVLSYLNSEFFFNILAQYGYNVKGGKFRFEQEKNIAELQQRLQIDLQVSAKVAVDNDYWYETYGIPKPDKTTENSENTEKSKETSADESDRDENGDKKSLFDRAKSFFV